MWGKGLSGHQPASELDPNVEEVSAMNILTWAHRPLESSKRIRHPDKITIIHNIVRTEISRMSPLHSDHPRSPPFERHSSQSSIVGHFLVASWHIDEVRLDSSVVVHHKRSADGLRWNDHHDSPWTSRDGWFLAIVLKKICEPKKRSCWNSHPTGSHLKKWSLSLFDIAFAPASDLLACFGQASGQPQRHTTGA